MCTFFFHIWMLLSEHSYIFDNYNIFWPGSFSAYNVVTTEILMTPKWGRVCGAQHIKWNIFIATLLTLCFMFYFNQKRTNNGAPNGKKCQPKEKKSRKIEMNKKKIEIKRTAYHRSHTVLVAKPKWQRNPTGSQRIRYDCKTAIIYESNVMGWIKVQSIKVKIKAEMTNWIDYKLFKMYALHCVYVHFVFLPQYRGRMEAREGDSKRKN